jgi:phosphoglycolate phosphatase
VSLLSYDYLFFDLDGTIKDSSTGIINSVKYAVEKLNLTMPSDEELLSFIGPPLLESFQVVFGLSEEEAQTAITVYREYFSAKGLYENEVYPGIDQLFKDLTSRDKKIFLATSKPEVFAIQILEHFDLAKYFSGMYGASMDSSRSSKVDVLKYAIAESGITDKSKAIMIGDRLHDMVGGTQNGIATLGVTYGFGDEEELNKSRAMYITHSASEILKYI